MVVLGAVLDRFGSENQIADLSTVAVHEKRERHSFFSCVGSVDRGAGWMGKRVQHYFQIFIYK